MYLYGDKIKQGQRYLGVAIIMVNLAQPVPGVGSNLVEIMDPPKGSKQYIWEQRLLMNGKFTH